MSGSNRANVNIKVDRRIRLAEIPDVKTDWQTEHTIRALVVDERSLALSFLAELKSRHFGDYRKIMKVAKLVACQPRVRNENQVRPGKKYRETYEMKGGHARLFFFYGPQEEVVCTHGFLKSKASRKEQSQEFAKCDTFRNLFYEGMEKGLSR
jgi:hypothetical protein